ncbi:type II toxin-antitoxin system RelE/ParE family toxin [Psychrobacter piscatorii]
MQHNGKPYREFYVFDPYRQVVRLCSVDKTGDKRFYKLMMPMAESIY